MDHQKFYHPSVRYEVPAYVKYAARRAQGKLEKWCRANRVDCTPEQLWRVKTAIYDRHRSIFWRGGEKRVKRAHFKIADITPLKRGKIFVNILSSRRDKNNRVVEEWAESLVLKKSGSLQGCVGGYSRVENRELPKPFEY